MLTPVFPGIRPYRSTFELLLPVLIVLLVLLPVRLVLIPVGALAVAQLAAMAVVAWFTYRHVPTTFAASPSVSDVGRATGSTGLLFVCASLPLYLGGEVRGANRTVPRVLVAAVAIVGVVFFVSALPLSGVPDELRDSAVPGVAIAQAYCGRTLAVTVGLLTALSILALIVAEYVALARLLHWLHGPPVRTLVAWIAVPFLAADAISLVNPARFYSDLLKPSLGALLVSQLIVFGLFPRFRRGPLALGAAAVAFALSGWGLYTLVWGGAST